jgi:hypothetical protein
MGVGCTAVFDRRFVRDLLGPAYYDKEHRVKKQDALVELERARFPYIQNKLEAEGIHKALTDHKARLNEEHERQIRACDGLIYDADAILREAVPSRVARSLEALKAGVDESGISLSPAQERIASLRTAEVARREKSKARTRTLVKDTAAGPSTAGPSVRAPEEAPEDPPAAKKPKKEDADALPPRRCPAPDCIGFLGRGTDETLLCGLCGIAVCQRCELALPTDAPAGSESIHQCRVDDVASVKAKYRDTRPCPSCGVRVAKVSGCNQMFCTACLKPWDWATGRVITRGGIHNPHYFDYLNARRAAGREREQTDVPPTRDLAEEPRMCANEVTAQRIAEIRGLADEDRKRCQAALRCALHLDDPSNMSWLTKDEQRALPYRPTWDDDLEAIDAIDAIRTRSRDRLSRVFILGAIDLAAYTRDLQKLNKRDEKCSVITEICLNVLPTVRDVLAGLSKDTAAQTVQALEELRNAINAAFQGARDTFRSDAVPAVEPGWAGICTPRIRGGATTLPEEQS